MRDITSVFWLASITPFATFRIGLGLWDCYFGVGHWGIGSYTHSHLHSQSHYILKEFFFYHDILLNALLAGRGFGGYDRSMI